MSVRTDWDLISSYAGLLALAASIIYSGSYGSLPVRQIFNFDVMETTPRLTDPSLHTRAYVLAGSLNPIHLTGKTKGRTMRKTVMTKKN